MPGAVVHRLGLWAVGVMPAHSRANSAACPAQTHPHTHTGREWVTDNQECFRLDMYPPPHMPQELLRCGRYVATSLFIDTKP